LQLLTGFALVFTGYARQNRMGFRIR